MKKIFYIIIIATFWNCTGSKQAEDIALIIENPPAEGFNKTDSDSTAIAIADSVMKAMGGREAWNNSHYVTWNFFDVRRHYWDKFTGDIRIESIKNDFIALINLQSMEGRVQKDGEEITNPDSLRFYIERAKNYWNNDAYWLFMPFKLKDSGVTLKYLGEDSIQNAGDAHLLKLTFSDVGTTPDNKYHVWVDKNSHLVRKWAYFRESTQEEPNLVTPWNDYQEYGNILLSGNRGQREITDIGVYSEVSEGVFNSFDRVNLL